MADCKPMLLFPWQIGNHNWSWTDGNACLSREQPNIPFHIFISLAIMISHEHTVGYDVELANGQD